MKKILLILTLAVTALSGSAVLFDNSFNRIKNPKSPIQPWLATAPGKKLPNGYILHYQIPVQHYNIPANYQGYHNYKNVDYAVIEIPGEGIAYGYVRTPATHGSGEIKDNPQLIFGNFKSLDGKTTEFIGKTPKARKAENVTKPNGTYTYMNYREYDPKDETSPDDEIISITFNPNGTYSMSYGRKYTQIMYPGNGMEDNPYHIIGGWYYDVDANATITGKWSMKGDSIFFNPTTKPKYTATTKYNKEALIDQFRREDEERYIPFTMNQYRRQFAAQAQREYSNAVVAGERKNVLEALQEIIEGNHYTFPRGGYRVGALGKNDITLLQIANKKADIKTYQKVYDPATWHDAVEVVSFYKEIADKLEKHAAEARRRSIVSQIAENPGGIKSFDEMVIYNLNDDETKANFCEILPEPDGTYGYYVGSLTFEGTKVTVDPQIARDMFVENTAKQIAANEAILEAAKNGKDKEAKNRAKEYFKKKKKQGDLSFTFNSHETFLRARQNAIDRLELQKQYL